MCSKKFSNGSQFVSYGNSVHSKNISFSKMTYWGPSAPYFWVPNGIRTHAAAFTEPSANHYTIGTI